MNKYVISVIVLLLFHVGFWVIVFQTTVSSNVIYLFIQVSYFNGCLLYTTAYLNFT